MGAHTPDMSLCIVFIVLLFNNIAIGGIWSKGKRFRLHVKHFAFSLVFQMDPKLRPSFPDIVKRLEDIQRRLKAEEAERERIHIQAEMDKKSIPKGV